jgi:hypothetical protein
MAVAFPFEKSAKKGSSNSRGIFVTGNGITPVPNRLLRGGALGAHEAGPSLSRGISSYKQDITFGRDCSRKITGP